MRIYYTNITMDVTETFTSSSEVDPLGAQPENMFEIKQEDFDYDNVRKSYFQELDIINKTITLSPNLLWNRLLLYNKILHIKMSNINNTSYEVITVEGEDWLIRHRLNKDEPISRYLCAEYCFDIIAKAHIETGHGDSNETALAIDSKYNYPKFCIPLVLKYCNLCSDSSAVLNKDKIKGIWYLGIVQMTKVNSTFNYILFYIEKFTEYTFLRPLMSKSVEEVSLELFKIFLVFGAPKKLFTTKESLDFTNMVAAKISTLSHWMIFRVLPIRSNVQLFKKSFNSIIDALNGWMKETGCDKWEVGCHIVQWKINNTYKVITSFNTSSNFYIDSSYNYFFGRQKNVFNYFTDRQLPEHKTNAECNRSDNAFREIDTGSSNYGNVKELMNTVELDIVDAKKVYASCHVCHEELLVQYKCWFCHNPVHSECGRIMRNCLKNKHIYTVRCKLCIVSKGAAVLSFQLH